MWPAPAMQAAQAVGFVAVWSVFLGSWRSQRRLSSDRRLASSRCTVASLPRYRRVRSVRTCSQRPALYSTATPCSTHPAPRDDAMRVDEAGATRRQGGRRAQSSLRIPGANRRVWQTWYGSGPVCLLAVSTMGVKPLGVVEGPAAPLQDWTLRRPR